jgi:phospholipid transport system substrate-binding protein
MLPMPFRRARRLLLIGFIALPWFGATLCAAADEASEPPAQTIVHETVNTLLARLHQEGPSVKDDTARLDAIAEELVLPHFDFDRMSQRALGRYWRDFSAEQKARFIHAFKTLLVRTYARTIAEYHDADVAYLPARQLAPKVVRIRSEITLPDSGRKHQLDFEMEQQGNDWQALDVTIDGISLVISYRAGFASDIGRLGVDGLIAQIESHVRGS